MAVSSTSSVLSINLAPKFISKTHEAKVTVLSNGAKLAPLFLNLGRNPNFTRLNAVGLNDIEPDLREEKRDPYATNGIDARDFKYGEYDGSHTYNEAEQTGTFWGTLAEEYAAAEPPTGFQGLISWLFLPAVAAGLAFHAPEEYLYIGAAVFAVVFCIIEMNKPDKPHNFEPQIYNMERGARDKLIADYNVMDIWDFNEKYGDVWDFTAMPTSEDIMKR